MLLLWLLAPSTIHATPDAAPFVEPGTDVVKAWVDGPVRDPFRALEGWTLPARLQWIARQRQRTNDDLRTRQETVSWERLYVRHLLSWGEVPDVATRGGMTWWVFDNDDGDCELRCGTSFVEEEDGEEQWTSDDPAFPDDYYLDLIAPSPDGQACVLPFFSHADTETGILIVKHRQSPVAHEIPCDNRFSPLVWSPDSTRFCMSGEFEQLRLGANLTWQQVLDPHTHQPLAKLRATEFEGPANCRLLETPTRASGMLYAQVDLNGSAISVKVLPAGGSADDAWTLWRESGRLVSSDVHTNASGTEELFAIVRAASGVGSKLLRMPFDGSAKPTRFLEFPADRPMYVCAGDKFLGVMIEAWEGWRFELYDYDGRLARVVKVPIVETLSEDAYVTDTGRLRVKVQGIGAAVRLVEYNPDTGERTLLDGGESTRHRLAPEVRLAEVPTSDGEVLRVRLVGEREALEKTSDHPTLLYLYGGFDISSKLTSSEHLEPWVAAGGLWVNAEVRGSGDRDFAWYQAGIGMNKSHAVSDSVAVIRWLIAEGYTDAEHLGVMGASHGGWLAAMAGLSAPESVQAVVSMAPLTDLVRLNEMTYGEEWHYEFGNPGRRSEQPGLLANSPYHLAGTVDDPPAFYIACADDDTRVESWNAYKLAARLQHGNPRRPTYLYANPTGGHGMAETTYEDSYLSTNTLIFLGQQLDLRPSR